MSSENNIKQKKYVIAETIKKWSNRIKHQPTDRTQPKAQKDVGNEDAEVIADEPKTIEGAKQEPFDGGELIPSCSGTSATPSYLHPTFSNDFTEIETELILQFVKDNSDLIESPIFSYGICKKRQTKWGVCASELKKIGSTKTPPQIRAHYAKLKFSARRAFEDSRMRQHPVQHVSNRDMRIAVICDFWKRYDTSNYSEFDSNITFNSKSAGKVSAIIFSEEEMELILQFVEENMDAIELGHEANKLRARKWTECSHHLKQYGYYKKPDDIRHFYKTLKAQAKMSICRYVYRKDYFKKQPCQTFWRVADICGFLDDINQFKAD